MNPDLHNFKLVRHSSCTCHGECSIEVGVQRREHDVLRLSYRASGDVQNIALPAPASPKRNDNLWRHTCFEVFLGARDGAYCEFNFSPSTQWAAYRFDTYRHGMSALALQSAPRISTEVTRDALQLNATVDLRKLCDIDVIQATMAIAAVIENPSGELSYWALQHPAGEPDFHHVDGFVAALTDNDKS